MLSLRATTTGIQSSASHGQVTPRGTWHCQVIFLTISALREFTPSSSLTECHLQISIVAHITEHCDFFCLHMVTYTTVDHVLLSFVSQVLRPMPGMQLLTNN
jgi:hypothetical protein